MSNVREVHESRSNGTNQYIAPMASNSERILRNGTKSSFNTVYENTELTRREVHNQSETLAHALESKAETLPSATFQEQVPTSRLLSSYTELHKNDKLSVTMHRITQKKVEYIYTSMKKESTMTVADWSFSDELHIGLGSTSNGFRTASFHFVKGTLTAVVKTGTLDCVPDRKIECWTQFSRLIYKFFRRLVTFFYVSLSRLTSSLLVDCENKPKAIYK